MGNARDIATRLASVRPAGDLATALDLTVQWPDNLEAAVGRDVLLDAMPNNFGGRDELRGHLEGLRRASVADDVAEAAQRQERRCRGCGAPGAAYSDDGGDLCLDCWQERNGFCADCERAFPHGELAPDEAAQAADPGNMTEWSEFYCPGCLAKRAG